MQALSRSCPAKINLMLRVGPLRPDGFHDVESLVTQIGLHDRLSAAPRDNGHLTLACSDDRIPADDTNLVLRAASALRQRLAQRGAAIARRGAHLTLDKEIPAGAGLGGGSSDAAATLRLLNELWSAELSHEELSALAAQIGSDVPLFLHGPVTAIGGRGEQVADLPLRIDGSAVLILPNMHLSTADVYRAFDALPPRAERPTLDDLLRWIESVGHVDDQPPALAAGARAKESPTEPRPRRIAAEQLAPRLYNDLEDAAFAVQQELGRLARRVARLTDLPVRMTGSGAALFVLVDGDGEAAELGSRLRASIFPRLIVRTLRL